jgi:hypothetical protein
VIRFTAFVALGVDFAVPVNFHFQPIGEGVHTGHPYPVQTARIFVGALFELSSGVENRHHDFQGGLPFQFGVRNIVFGLHRNSTPIISNGDRIVFVDDDIHRFGVPRQHLVDRIVHRFVDQMVQSRGARGPNVHGRPVAHGLESFQHLNGR